MKLRKVRDDLRKRALSALSKPSTYGLDIDLSRFTASLGSDIMDIESYTDAMLSVGVDPEERGRGGSYYQIDNVAAYSSSRYKGLIVKPISEALEDESILEYYWKAVPVDLDKYTATAFLYEKDGYYIEVKDRVEIPIPVQACILLKSPSLIQVPHNIVVVGEGSKLHLITGCTVARENPGVHIGISEFYVKKNGLLTFTMIHSWSKGMHIRPRTIVYVEDGGIFISQYISTSLVDSIQSYPTIHLVGENSSSHLSSIIIGRGSSHIDIGGAIELKAPGSTGEVTSRVISMDESRITSRGRISGFIRGVKGHIECRGLILSENSSIYAIPELEAKAYDVQLTHEAAVGRIAEEEIIYLMAKGFTEDEARSMIIRGFLQPKIPIPLPRQLVDYLSMAMEKIAYAL
ncbi:MAG: SufD family Fe-S cluster assembly protein [Candidatus Bathyarchaeia archaeon]